MIDRRSVRRQATIDEILAAAWRHASVNGLAGLSLRQLAHEVGMQPQSLYSYFESKNAIYDAMFAQGCREFAEGQRSWDLVGDLRADLTTICRYFIDFCVQNPARYQLLFQRTIPGFEPSPESFAISEESLAAVQEHLAALGIDRSEDIDLFTAVGTGLAAQQISNDPGGERWLRLVATSMDMFIAHVANRTQSMHAHH